MVPRPPWRLVLGSRRKGEGGVEGSVSTFPPPCVPTPQASGNKGRTGRSATASNDSVCVSATIAHPPPPRPDLDECRVRSLCQHACRNTEGSYQCLCPAGYRLLPSGKNCQGERAPASSGWARTGLPGKGRLSPAASKPSHVRVGAGRGGQSTPGAHSLSGSHIPRQELRGCVGRLRKQPWRQIAALLCVPGQLTSPL